MTNANPYLPPRRGAHAHSNPTALPQVTHEPANEPTPTPAKVTSRRHTVGSRRARVLRDALRSRDGFASAVQTAELLQPPVSLRRPQY